MSTRTYISEEEYLEIEERAEQKSEYFQGEMFPRETTIQHVTINGNLLLVLFRETAGSDCRPFSSLRVATSTGLYAYPDLVVICGKPEASPKDPDSATNPKVIIEILSPSTENYDRGRKFAHYRSIPSFDEYLLIEQNQVHAEHIIKRPDGRWLLHETSDAEAIISLESIGIRFKLNEAYSGVEF